MIRPLNDRLVVKPIDEPLSLVLEVVQFEKKAHRGEVLAVGPNVKWGVQVGDVIRFTDIFKFPDFLYHGERLLILQEADVCFVEDPWECVVADGQDVRAA